MRFRLIVEIEYDGADEKDEERLRGQLSSLVHTAASSGMFTDGVEELGITASQIAAACQRLEEPEERAEQDPESHDGEED